MEDRLITYNEVCHNGACFEGVKEFYIDNFYGETAVKVEYVIAAGAELKHLNKDGYGNGYGYGYGNGYGYGYGYGYGNGDSDGYGDSDGDSYGDGYGYGYGNGYGDGYGDGGWKM